ncbi:MAG: HAMP domain-containing sensor histidine kinase [Pseudomonadota bacterium]
MVKRFRQMFQTTAARLTLLYTLLFGLLAIGVVFYISFNSGRILLQQYREVVDEEVQSIARSARRGGVRRLIPMIERRSRRPGANLYLVADPSGLIIAGNVRAIDSRLLSRDGWKLPPFPYLGFDESDEERRAIARVFTLPGDLRLLVGRDVGDVQRFRGVVRRASAVSLLVMVLTGVLLWLFVGRRALRHIDRVSKSSDRIIAGDLSERLPLAGTGDEFDRLSQSLNHLLARIEKLNVGVRTMSDSIAHDLRTPLTRLRNRAEAALGQTGQVDQEILDDIIADADGLIRTFDALLMISQVGSGARAVDLQPLQLAPIVNDVHELFEPLAQEQGVALEVDIQNQGTVLGNRELLAQALTNLIDNALKYGGSDRNPRITITLKQAPKRVLLSVADNGEGIPEAERDRVKERFVRLDTSRNRPGSGLGLSLVEAVVSLHGGALQLEDNRPGLCVVLDLPAT